jgi:hypothetical protein
MYIIVCRSKSCPFQIRFNVSQTGTAVTSILTLHTRGDALGLEPVNSIEALTCRHRDIFRTDKEIKPAIILAKEKAAGIETTSYLQALRAKRAMEGD